MKIQPASFSVTKPIEVVSEESQHGRIEGFWHNSDVQTSIHAARIERAMRNAAVSNTRQSLPERPAQTHQQIIKTAKNAFHNIAITCGALFIPSFAFAVLGPIGLIVPASLLAVGVIAALIGGKLTPEMEEANAIRAAQNAEYDPR